MAPQKYEFDMAMTCDGCLNAAKRVLGKIDVTDVDGDLTTKKIWVTTEKPSEEILEQLKKTGKEITFVKVVE